MSTLRARMVAAPKYVPALHSNVATGSSLFRYTWRVKRHSVPQCLAEAAIQGGA